MLPRDENGGADGHLGDLVAPLPARSPNKRPGSLFQVASNVMATLRERRQSSPFPTSSSGGQPDGAAEGECEQPTCDEQHKSGESVFVDEGALGAETLDDSFGLDVLFGTNIDDNVFGIAIGPTYARRATLEAPIDAENGPVGHTTRSSIASSPRRKSSFFEVASSMMAAIREKRAPLPPPAKQDEVLHQDNIHSNDAKDSECAGELEMVSRDNGGVGDGDDVDDSNTTELDDTSMIGPDVLQQRYEDASLAEDDGKTELDLQSRGRVNSDNDPVIMSQVDLPIFPSSDEDSSEYISENEEDEGFGDDMRVTDSDAEPPKRSENAASSVCSGGDVSIKIGQLGDEEQPSYFISPRFKKAALGLFSSTDTSEPSRFWRKLIHGESSSSGDSSPDNIAHPGGDHLPDTHLSINIDSHGDNSSDDSDELSGEMEDEAAARDVPTCIESVTMDKEDMERMVASTMDVRHDFSQQLVLRPYYQRVGLALQTVLGVLPVTKLTPSCYQAVSSLQYSEQALDAQFVREIRELGEVLQGDPVPRLSPGCYRAIEQMASSGQLPTVDVIIELRESKALAFCARPTSGKYKEAPEEQLAELRAAVIACTIAASKITPATEMLALWSVVHTATSIRISAEAADAAAQAGKLELIVHDRSRKTTLTPMVDVESAEKNKDDSEFDWSKAEDIAKSVRSSGLEQLDKAMTMRRMEVDAALQALCTVGVTGLLNLIDRYGIPLLRFEIIRDFVQIAGLFFSNLYTPVLEFFAKYRPPSWIYDAIIVLRKLYNWMAFDWLRYLHIDEDKLEKAFVGLLLASILILHWSFLAVVIRLWWTMPRMADKVRHGHEATTWAKFATHNSLTTKFATVFITICLTVYLPLSQIAFNVLVVTDQPEDEKTAEAVQFASQFRQDGGWFFSPLEAILLLFTFTAPLPFLLTWSIKKNRPNGSLDDEDVTYDLDGKSVKFDDKVYTKLVSSDPSQLGCPYRSLYAGFERNWSTYKVMQMVAKIVMAVLVVAAGKYDRLGGTLISTLYFIVVVLACYSQPFIDPLDDAMDIISKVTALITAVGATGVAYVNAYVSKLQYPSNYPLEHIENFMIAVIVVHIINLIILAAIVALGVDKVRHRTRLELGWLLFSDTTRGTTDVRASKIVPRWELEKEAKHRVWQTFWRSILLQISKSSDTADGKTTRRSKRWRFSHSSAPDLSKPGDTSEKLGNNTTKVTAASRIASLEEAVVASGIHRVESHWFGTEHTYTSQLRRLARDTLEGVDVYWDNPYGTRDGHLDSVSCFGKMYVVPYPFHCVVVYDDAQDEAIIRDECAANSPLETHTNLAKLLALNFKPEVMAKRELRQKLRALSERKTPIKLPFTRTEKIFIWPILKRMAGPTFKGKHYAYFPIFSMPGYVKFKCNYKVGEIRVQDSNDGTGAVLRVSKVMAMQSVRTWTDKILDLAVFKRPRLALFRILRAPKVQGTVRNLVRIFRWIIPLPIRSLFTRRDHSRRQMADGFDVTIKYRDGSGEVELPNGSKLVVTNRTVIMNADHIGLKPSMEESDILARIFRETRVQLEVGLKKLRKQHRNYRRSLTRVQEQENAALSDDFWSYVYNNPHLPRDKLEQYLRVHETNPLLRNLPDSHKLPLDVLYKRQKWVFSHPQTTLWYVFWDDVYAHNSDMKCLKDEDVNPFCPTAICYNMMTKEDLTRWLEERNLFKKWSLFYPGLLDLLYEQMTKLSSNTEDGYQRDEGHEDEQEKEEVIYLPESVSLETYGN